ncbi:ABC transporter ATP-binding protein [Nocardiopsis sp. CNT-189]|uniref:ABC transporter ATP-binding protein n=1 Tax=Nocardiopsis oceanisediminis TaxID=2816862 RepID=UPI003B381052
MIEVRELTKTYADDVGIKGVSFSVRPGEVTGFLGPNGAGKSTTMRLILGLGRASSGTATVNGRPYTGHPAPLREAGGMLDASAFHPGRKAIDHLRLLARTHGIPRSRAAAVLEEVGLESAAHRRPGGFSLGMRQRFGLAAALLGDPGVLILDEPFNGLDPEGARWMRRMLRRFAEQGRTVLLSSHLLSEMEDLADRVVLIARGRILAETTTQEFIESAGGRNAARVVASDAEALCEVVERSGGTCARTGANAVDVAGIDRLTIERLASAKGIEIYDFVPQRTSLEEAFMKLTRTESEYRGTEAGGDRR